VQRGDRDGDVLAAQLGDDQFSPTEVTGREQRGGLSDAAGADMVADRFTGMRHIDRVELSGRVTVQRHA
jgi:hypothetical protein